MERSWEVAAELFLALEEEDVPLVKGLTARWLQTLEEVARGSPWEVAWAMMPIEDPCGTLEVGAVSLEQHSMAHAYVEDMEKIAARRNTNPRAKPGSFPGNPGGQRRNRGYWKGGKWVESWPHPKPPDDPKAPPPKKN